MTSWEKAKLLLAQMPMPHTKTALEGVDKTEAASVRAIINKLTRKSGAVVFTKLTGGVMTCWRVE
jgi:hypothetical protein